MRKHILSLSAKRIVLLPEIRDNYSYHRNQHLRGRRINTYYIHKKLQTEIVHSQVQYHNAYIAQQLTGTTQRRLCESNILVQPKTSKERYGKYNAQSSNMRRKSYKTQIQHLMPKHKIIHQEIKHPVKHHIAHTANTITEKLLRTKTTERSVQPPDDFTYPISQSIHGYIC